MVRHAGYNTPATPTWALTQDRVRRKSRKDIQEQLRRIAAGYNYEDDNPRIEKAFDIASRYEENIMRTKRHAKDAMATALSIGQKRHENFERLQNRKYSQRTYMGLNEG